MTDFILHSFFWFGFNRAAIDLHPNRTQPTQLIQHTHMVALTSETATLFLMQRIPIWYVWYVWYDTF